jgi:uncharacterized RDD family membrane protein YckC
MDMHILSEVEQELYLQPVSLGKRFLNLLIDIIGIYFLILLLGFLLGFVSAFAVTVNQDKNNYLLQLCISYLCNLLYYTLFEGFTKGRSLGKFITGTVAIKIDGSTITWKDAFLRSLCRIVPFESLSVFFDYAPWHDKWTKTTVVKKIA